MSLVSLRNTNQLLLDDVQVCMCNLFVCWLVALRPSNMLVYCMHEEVVELVEVVMVTMLVSVCVRACVRACARAHTHTHTCVCVCVCVCV